MLLQVEFCSSPMPSFSIVPTDKIEWEGREEGGKNHFSDTHENIMRYLLQTHKISMIYSSIPDLIVGSQSDPLWYRTVHSGSMSQCSLQSKRLMSTLT